MSILQLPHARPTAIVFDWHATLADTMDAMYHAVDDVLPELDRLGLVEHLLHPDESKTLEDAKLVKFVRQNARLHPRIKAERRISRTDIFEVLFGENQKAKRIAHRAFDDHYKKYFGAVSPMEADARVQMERLASMGIRLGVLSNRARHFMAHEIYTIDTTGWHDLFDTMVCGDDVEHRKPHPDLVLKALANLNMQPSPGCWYVGDSTTDIIAAKTAGVTAIFYNGAGWDQQWLDKIFPGTVRHPHRPDAVVRDLPALVELAQHFIEGTATS